MTSAEGTALAKRRAESLAIGQQLILNNLGAGQLQAGIDLPTRVPFKFLCCCGANGM